MLLSSMNHRQRHFHKENMHVVGMVYEKIFTIMSDTMQTVRMRHSIHYHVNISAGLLFELWSMNSTRTRFDSDYSSLTIAGQQCTVWSFLHLNELSCERTHVSQDIVTSCVTRKLSKSFSQFLWSNQSNRFSSFSSSKTHEQLQWTDGDKRRTSLRNLSQSCTDLFMTAAISWFNPSSFSLSTSVIDVERFSNILLSVARWSE